LVKWQTSCFSKSKSTTPRSSSRSTNSISRTLKASIQMS
jgi:hypothetical protein